MSNKNDIHELHAELIHTASDIQFQNEYQNGGDTATIIDLGTCPNTQKLLEKYFSLVGIPKFNVIPNGVKNRVNTTFTVSEEFIPETLVVYSSGS